MRIISIEYVLCRSELAKPIPLSCGALTHRNFGLIRIETDDGTVGWGETSINFPPWTYRERAATIAEGLAPLLIGERAHDVLRLRDKMVDATRSFTRMWSEGALSQAISGIEMALWDVLGKDLDMPVATLLGGICRDTFTCYATGIRSDDPGAGAREAVAGGYGAIKMRVGFGDAADIAAAHAVRDAIGPDVALLIDANQAFDLPRARRMIAALAEVNPYWIEEPVLSDDFDAQQQLRLEFPEVPMAWGENSFRLAHYRTVAEAGLADYIMPDPCRCGGMGAAMDAARAVAAHGLPISAHHYGSDLGFAAMLHFMAANPRTDLVLRDIAPVPLRDNIVTETLVPVNGQVRLPPGPGFGVTPDLDVIAASRVLL
jgi:L-alanine-DL-glutamate epimerase-like enolase superfamily enzyme